MLIEFIKPDFEFNNDAGCLRQLVHDGWKQVNVITSFKDSERGGHYHKYNRECFYVVSGSFRLIVWKDDIREEYEMKANDFFLIPEDVFHSFLYHDDTVLIGMYDRGVELDEHSKDIWRE